MLCTLLRRMFSSFCEIFFCLLDRGADSARNRQTGPAPTDAQSWRAAGIMDRPPGDCQADSFLITISDLENVDLFQFKNCYLYIFISLIL